MNNNEDRETNLSSPPMNSSDGTSGTAPSFFNRELSWIDFNERVLGEALKKDMPPLERFKFLSIVSSNFDEFFMVRVAAIKQARNAGAAWTDPAGLSPGELLGRISRRVRSIIDRQFNALISEVIPGLARGGLCLRRPLEWSTKQRDYLESLFVREIYPLLTPLRLGSPTERIPAEKDYPIEEEPLPSTDNYSLYVAFLLESDYVQGQTDRTFHSPEGHFGPTQRGSPGLSDLGSGFRRGTPVEHISIVRIPPALKRIIWLPWETKYHEETKFPEETKFHMGSELPSEAELPSDTEFHTETDHFTESIPAGARQTCWTLLEDVVQAWGSYLYPGYRVMESLVFKINRDADFSVDEKRDEDFIEAMAEVLEGREKSMPIRMVYSPGSKKIRDYLARRLSLEEEDLYGVTGPLNLGSLYDLVQTEGFDHLRVKSWKIYFHPAFPTQVSPGDQTLWDRIRAGDIILHLPYQSFDPVVRFFQEAASDPQVTAIKTALYRTSGDSPIVRALEQASLSGKHVTAVVELKARFDEGRNISWANRLEKAGVIVVYGLANLKIHAKATIVMRREYDRIKRYIHLSTGNYNDKTAKYYEDISLFTAREDIAYDAGLLFNMITGYSAVQSMGKLVIAPTALKRRILDLIARETSRSSPEAPGRIMAKMNALADPEIIWALYRASQAGVKVFLNVRGICMLVPGVKDLSDNIKVVSVIDRYLEHSRIYYFANGGAEELYLASADWMSRNLERRVELMFPILQEDSRKAVLETLSAYFRDNCQAWLLDSQGGWTRLKPAPGEEPFSAQAFFHSRAAKAQAEEHPGAGRGEFIVRRSTPN